VLLPPRYFQYLSADVTPRTGACGVLLDCSYTSFSNLQAERRRVLFAGANDGFLHAFDVGVFNRDTTNFPNAFDLGTGRELFAYAPQALMSGKFPATLAFPPTPQYFVDGSVALGDVFIDTAHNGTPSDGNRSWKTVLVGGLRQGGNYYYALDVTQPDKIDVASNSPTFGQRTADKDSSPDCLNGTGNCPAAYPNVLWELTDNCTVDATTCASNPPVMGQTWSRPVIGRIRVNDGSGNLTDRYVAIFGGGFDPNFTPGTDPPGAAIQGRALYVVNVETGKILYKATQGVNDGGTTVQFAPMPAAPGVVDFNDDGYLDVAYIGDLNGRMWELDLTQGVCTGCGTSSETMTFTTQGNAQPFLLYDSLASSTAPIQPIFYDPAIIFISGGTPPKLGVAFGSGYRADLSQNNGNVNRFNMVIDSGTAKTFHDSDLVNLTPTGGVTPAGTGPAPTTAGFFLDFATQNEKAVSTVFSTLGNLSVVTFNPPLSCLAGGQSFRYRFNFATGQGGYALTLPPTGQPGALADYRQAIGEGLVSAAQGQASTGDIMDVGLSTGGVLTEQHTPATLRTISQSWKEQ
jgi:Tfp pilus tip-associated adhesin PilY1